MAVNFLLGSGHRQATAPAPPFSLLQDRIVTLWKGKGLNPDHANLPARLWTWQHADISANPVYRSDFNLARRALTARPLLLPGATGLSAAALWRPWRGCRGAH
jgi:homoserine O-acetyltransferase